MARTQVQSELLAVNSISGTIIADNAITATHIATNAISGTLVQDGGIVTVMIAANNVTATKIVTDAVQTRHIADDQVTAAKLANSINTDIATGVTANTTANAALPKAGGTLTGDVTFNGTNLFFNGAASTAGHNLALENSDTFANFFGSTSSSIDKGYKFFTGNQGGDLAFTINADKSIAIPGTLGVDGAATFNESGADVNFRIESDGLEYMFFVDAGNNRVAINHDAPSGIFHVAGHTSNVASIFESNGAGDTVPLQLKVKANNGTTSTQGLYGNAGSASTDNTITLGTSGTSGLTVTNGGNVGIGSATPTKGKLQVDGGSGGSADFDALAIKHVNTTTTGDGPVMRFEGSYNSADWALAEMKATNGGAGHGANFQIQLHPGDGTQSSAVLPAFSLKRTVSNQLEMHVHAGGTTTYADEASTTTAVANTSCLVSIQSQRKAGGNSISYDAGLFFCHYGIDSGVSVVELADPGGTFAPTDTDGMVCVYKGNNSANVVVKNRLGYSTGLSVHFIQFLGN